MKEKADEIISFIQERCLWQFHSRAWDREENINGTMDNVAKLLTGETVVAETKQEKCAYADAKVLTDQIKEKFSWVNELEAGQKKELVEAVKAKLTDIVITKCLNGEINVPFY
ncbi:Fe-only/vanadium nitrogenase subunit delta [Clostridium sp. DJ247]|uniref:Fe-only/vanadium nitrogenase subunit delta n=1 Tax=Clostridium sp. DJ247 TaxID=2726188 RepID=UPI0016234ACE|nr:Fe-only/vanadium nitrogenase subunit delta [Clostridium sp. DJ247]MBC2582795.1 nitrogenase, subunit delta [Clostridium sp. DJ247]